MRGRAPTAGEGPPACPFVAFAEEADSRSGMPDHRHRCYAQEPPEPRAYAHQERYCLTSAYPGCAYFQDWAVRYAAESVAAPALVGAARGPEDRAGFEREAPPQAHFDRAGRPTRPTRAAAAQLSAFDAFDAANGPERGVEYPRARDYSDAVNRSRAGELEPAAASLRTRSGTRTAVVNGGSNGHGPADPYSGYPTAARLLGITPPPVELEDDEPPEPGKWERSGRLQSWLEDAELGASRGRFAAVEEVAELEAGVIATRPSQARRAAMPAAPAAARVNNARPALSWERRAPAEGRVPARRTSIARISPVLVAGVALVLTAVLLFVLPSMLSFGGNQKRSAAGTLHPTARPTAAPTDAPASAAPAQPTARVYTVAAGDSLSRIAFKFRTTVRDLLDANPQITDPARIHIGQKVTIPVPAAPSP